MSSESEIIKITESLSTSISVASSNDTIQFERKDPEKALDAMGKTSTESKGKERGQAS
jgi:hypothetical protein